ncbi:MAG: hypothetical protein U9O87_09250 [Verrucomicrobiota bacterium]|nr:hypothetical protein [Verrucomicrobiota bacterium]
MKAKEKAGKKQNFELYLQAKKDFDSIVDMLREYNPKRIYQWGSLLNSEQFDVNSDIDIAVEGIKSVAIFF